MDWKQWLLTGTGATIILWLLGKAKSSTAYTGFRATCGVGLYKAGSAISQFGNARLKGLYEPVESLVTDFLGFQVEQFFAGLRKDNPVALAAQVERLKDVGSENRLAAAQAAVADAVEPPVEAI